MTLHQPHGSHARCCPIRDVLNRIGDRWSLLVLHELERGTLRFGELKKRIPDISQRMLAQTLRHLEQDGLVSREVFPSVPPRVEYTLTPLGVTLLDRMQGLFEWAVENHGAIRAARSAYVAPAAQAAQ
jgi:DNA-binding HxlR family transcriptional regulator